MFTVKIMTSEAAFRDGQVDVSLERGNYSRDFNGFVSNGKSRVYGGTANQDV